MTDLMKFATFMEEHKALSVPGSIFLHSEGSPSVVKAAVEAFVRGADGKVSKATVSYDDSKMELTRYFGELRVFLHFSKSALGCQKVTTLVPTETWECGPLLDAIAEVGK